MYPYREMMIKRHKIIQLLLFIGLMLIPFCSQSSIRIDSTFKPDKGQSFGTITSMVELADGSLLVADRELGQLYKLGADTREVILLKEKGIFASRKIGGMGLAGDQMLVLSNMSDDEFVTITLDAQLVTRMGHSGSRAGQISRPQGIAFSENRRIYIADTGNNRISVFGADGVYLASLGKKGLQEKDRLRKPSKVFVDAKERLYVFEDARQGQIAILDKQGRLVKRIDHGQLEALTEKNAEFSTMAIDKYGLIYIADAENGRVYQIDWEENKRLKAFGSKGDERGQFRSITSLLALQDGRLAVADSRNNKIEIYQFESVQKAKPEQNRLPTVTRYLPVKMSCTRAYRVNEKKALCINRDKAEASLVTDKSKLIKTFGKFKDPVAAAVTDKNIVILDGERIKVFDLQGNAQYEGKGYGGEGSAIGKLNSPKSIYLRHNKIYVADTGNRRVQIYSLDGIYLNQITNPKDEEQQVFEKPVSIVVDSHGNIFVADKSKKQLHVFTAERDYLYSLGAKQTAQDVFTRIYDLAMDSDNNLYVLAGTEDNRYTVQVYNGPSQVIAFSSESDSDVGLSDPVNLSVDNSNRRLVGVYDQYKKRMLNFSYQQIPAQVGSVEVIGGVAHSSIRWSAVPGGFVKGYNVYGANQKQGQYEFVTQVYENSALIKHASAQPKTFYKVNAFTGLGALGKFSRVREDVFIKAYKHYQAKEYAQVVAVLEPLLEQDVPQAEALKYLGLSYLGLDKVNQAVNAFQMMSLIAGFEQESLNLQVKALVAAEDYIAAKAIVDKVIENNTAVIDTYVLCGELSLNMGDAIGAVTCLEEAIARDEKNLQAHFLIGDAYVKLGIVDKGLEEFSKAAELQPDNPDVWFRSGLIMKQLGKLDEAIKRFDKALQLDKKHLGAKLALAKSWLDKKEYAKLKNIAISLAGQKDTAAEGHYLLALAARAKSRNAEALLALVKATRMDKTHIDAWLMLADVYVLMGKKEKLQPTLLAASNAAPHSFEAAFRLGQLEFENKKYAAASEQLGRAVQLKGDDYPARLQLAKSLYADKDYKQAFTHANEASRLNADDYEPLVLMSNISNRQGKIGKAIDYMQNAMQKKNNSLDLNLALGRLYTENNLFDQAKSQLEKTLLLDKSHAATHALLGDLYLSRRLFDKAIASYDKAVKLKSTQAHRLALDKAYAEKKKSLEFKSNAPQIVLKDLKLQQVFSAAYKQYAGKPVGRIRVQNTSGTDYGNLKLTFSIKGYMDFPSTQPIARLAANETQEIDLLASFNNRILEIDEDTGVQVEVALHFVRDGRDDAIRLTQAMTIYGKNAIVWNSKNMVGSFVTPKDDTLRDFVRQALNENKPQPGPLSENLVTAMTLFNVFTAHGIRYVVDPNNPYSELDSQSVDYVQFARETLKVKSGDCDDLSVLMSAALENVGIKTAMLGVPGHLLMMFDSGVSALEKDRVSLQPDLMVIRDGRVWIALEVTMIGTSFAEAWAEGARKYHQFKSQQQLEEIPMLAAWKEFLPVTLKPANYSLQLPASSSVRPLVNREQNILVQKSLARLVKPYETMAVARPEDSQALMQVGIIYAKNKLYSRANEIFDRIQNQQPDNSAVHNNRGNIYYAQGDYQRAIETYSYAEQLASNDPGVKINMSMSYYQLGQLADARTKFEQARTISHSITDQYAALGQLLSQ